jgi:acyl-CoA synthetase (AMP-forming)/AMP-acid ligase II
VNAGLLLTKAASRFAERPAVRFSGQQLTYGELNARARRFGRGLRAIGAEPSDRVAIYMGNSPEYVVALFGLFKMGLVAVPVNAKLHASELTYILEHSGCRGLIVDQGRLSPARQALRTCAVEAVIEVGGDSLGTPFDAVLEVADSGDPDAEVDPDDLAWLFYTSGTTGRPKGAMLTHRNLVSMAVSCLADICSFQPEDVVLHAAPLSHGSGLYMLPAIARGSTNVIYDGPRFLPDDVLRTVEREQVTVIAFLAPTMIVLLLDGSSLIDTGSLRAIIYGGAPIHLDHARAAIRRFGQILVQLYGQGESPMTISYLRAVDHRLDDEDALTSAGWARTDVEVRIVDESARELSPAEVGEVAVRGDVVMRGYWGDAAATRSALHGSWLRTGDIGRFDTRGRLHLLDRKHDMIITGGSNVYPVEIEQVLVLHPLVREAAVFGLPDPLWGEAVVAAVVPAGAPPSPDELIAFCAERLAGFKKPRRVVFVDELPKNAYGKVLRRELRDALAAHPA